MTRADAIQIVRSAIAEPVPAFWTDAEIGNYINSGLHAMCESKGIEDVQRILLDNDIRVAVPPQTKFIEKVSLYSFAGTLSFVETAPLTPVDGDEYCNPTTMTWYVFSSTTALWTETDAPDKDDLEETGVLVGIEDGYIKFSEAQSGILEVFLYRYPDDTTLGTDILELPEAYCYGALAYAEAQAFLKDDNFPQYDRRMAEFARIRVGWEMERTYKMARMKNRWI